MESVNELFKSYSLRILQYFKIRQICSATNDVMFSSLPQTVPIHCHNLDRMAVDMFYMVCFSTNIRNIFNNCSEIITGIWNINSYIYTRKLWSSVFMSVIITFLRSLEP